MSADPLRHRLEAIRAKRRPAVPAEEPPADPPPLVSQGVRSTLPPPAEPSPDDLIRDAVAEARGRPRRVRLS